MGALTPGERIAFVRASLQASARVAGSDGVGGHAAGGSGQGGRFIVQGDVTVPAGATLTIWVGAEVRFAASDLLASGLALIFRRRRR